LPLRARAGTAQGHGAFGKAKQRNNPMADIKTGDKVAWDWGDGTATGKVEKTYDRKVTRSIKGSKITRNGSKDDPAIYIKQDDGDAVLKLASELRKA
jgi:hypothetical protein